MTTTVNDTLTIGKQLVDLCREGKNIDAIKTMYADNACSVEVCDGPTWEKMTSGKDKILAKNEWWSENHEVHSATLNGPFPNEDRFIVFMDYDVTSKAGPMAGQRMKMQEMGLYTVADGQIVKEEFFYDMTGC